MIATGKNSTGYGWRLIRTGLSVLLLSASAVCWGGPRRAAFQAHPQAHGGGQHTGNGAEFHAPNPQARGAAPHPGNGAEVHAPNRNGQQHLPQWWATHRNLPPNKQAEALRREPGFRNLPQDQQQRLINRLNTFNQRPPEQQQRILGRVEAFEHLSPERQQEVRGASQALGRMSPDRQVAIRHAFQQLRAMPPEQRQQMLNSSYGAQFSPQERTVLGNFLSIEPYQQGHIVTPYFGR